MSISSCPGKMVQLDIYNVTTVMNGDTFQIISLKFLLIMSMTEAADEVEVHAMAEDPSLDCYISAIGLLITLME